MGALAVYQAGSNRDRNQNSTKLALEALGLSSEDGKDVVQSGSIVYTQRDYKDFASIIGTVTLTFTIGELKEGISHVSEGTKKPGTGSQ